MSRAPIYREEAAQWRVSAAAVNYLDAVSSMQNRATAIASGAAKEQVWLLEHPALYSAGTSAKDADLITPDRFPVFNTGRGGQYTYHGPGQRVGYFMLDLRARGRDVRAFVAGLEDMVIGVLADIGVTADRREGRIGVWVALPDGGEAKIAAIGVRIRRWVSFHGISINVDPNLDHFNGIVPCGIAEHGVTSLRALGLAVTMDQVDAALMKNFQRIFGPVTRLS